MDIFPFKRMSKGVDVDQLKGDYKYETLRLLRHQQFIFLQIQKIKKIKELAKHAGIELEI